MTNGDETKRDEGSESAESGVPQTTGETGSSSTVSSIDEGWGAGEASIDEVVENVRVFFEQFRGEMLTAWLVYAAVALVLQSVEVGIYFVGWMLGDLGGGIFGLLMLPVSILIALVYPLVGVGQMTLYGPMRRRVFEGHRPAGWKEVIQEGLTRFWPVFGAFLILAVTVPIASMACLVPGLILAFFAIMAPYYLATRESMGIGEGFTRSYEAAKRYWQIFGITIGALLAAGFVFGCVAGVGTLLSGLPAPIGPIFADYAMWLAAMVAQLALFVAWGGVFITVDEKESGESIQAVDSTNTRSRDGSAP